MDFDTWFAAQGYDEQHRAMFRVVWDAAQENAGEEGSIYLSPEERREAQRALSALHRERLDSVALATKPYTCPDAVGINGLTEAETSATASVFGLK